MNERRIGSVGKGNHPIEERILRVGIDRPISGSGTLSETENVLDIQVCLSAVIGVAGALEIWAFRIWKWKATNSCLHSVQT